MTEPGPVYPEDLLNLTDQDIIKLLDATWPWPLDAVQQWFEDFYNTVLGYFWTVVGWIYDRVKPLFDTVWSWIQGIAAQVGSTVLGIIMSVWDWLESAKNWIVTSIGSLLQGVWSWLQTTITGIGNTLLSLTSQVWSWLQTGFASVTANISAWFSTLMNSISQFAIDIGQKVSAINQWFSNEFIDPFIDWLVQLPSKLWEGLGVPVVNAVKAGWSWLLTDDNWKKVLIGALIAAAVAALVIFAGPIVAAIGAVVSAIGSAIVAAAGAIGAFFSTVGGAIGGWIIAGMPAVGTWAASVLPAIGGWFMAHAITLLGAGGIITLEATGKLEVIIGKFVTPAITAVLDWAESMGPISPTLSKDISGGISKIASFTIAGLAAMTLAGEFLSPLKHLGLGHVAAMVYDLINYKTLTAAFMGVLAFVYIKTPLTYYYNKIARPNLPDERGLAQMASQRVITEEEFTQGMQFQGYADNWTDKFFQIAFRPVSPYILRSLAEAGLLNDEFLTYCLQQAGYDDRTIPYIKQMMTNLSSSQVQTLSASTAMTRYQEGFDNEAMLKQNLAALGVDPGQLDRYVFAANLKYLYDYQTDLKNYYIDLYHRREIEDPELRTSLAAVGILPDRIGLYVQAQSIKRLKAAAVAEDPAISVQFDTIRDRRKKQLITREEEVTQLVAIGKELPYALAIADNDDVALAPSGSTIVATPLPQYETEEGKIRVDTIRRLRRQAQTSDTEELESLLALEMPQSLASAIVENDSLRIKKSSGGE